LAGTKCRRRHVAAIPDELRFSESIAIGCARSFSYPSGQIYSFVVPANARYSDGIVGHVARRNRKREDTMNYQAIRSQIVKARLEQSVALGEVIAEVIMKSWQTTKRATDVLCTMIEAPSNYLPRSQA
jgi:hypothetical protein